MPGFTMSDVLRRLRYMLGDKRTQGQTDFHLLRRFTATVDEAAFATLVERHGAMVLNVCRRVLGGERESVDCLGDHRTACRHRNARVVHAVPVEGYCRSGQRRQGRRQRARKAYR